MSNRPTSTPKMTRHATGQAVVRLGGRDHYLGPFGSVQAQTRFDALVSRWLANGRRLPERGERPTVNELVLAYITQYLDQRWPEGDPENHDCRRALKVLRDLHGRCRLSDFGPLKLREVMDYFLSRDWTRGQVVRQMSRVKRLFRWGCEREWLDGNTYHALQCVRMPRKGDPRCRESEPVPPAPIADVEAAKAELPAHVAAMVDVQLLTGCRAGEVCSMRPCDVDRSGDVWAFTPCDHKTKHHGKRRTVFIGPKCQAVLSAWLDAAGDEEHVFRPAQRNGGPKFQTREYRQHVHRACDRAGVPKWNVGQLRHNFATACRADATLDAVQVLLGHSEVSTTQVYALADRKKAEERIRRVG